jgi:hypothetical protein
MAHEPSSLLEGQELTVVLPVAQVRFDDALPL